MTLNYKIDKEDFLIYQLYIASISDRLNKKLRQTKQQYALICFILGIFSFFTKDIKTALFFSISAIIVYFFYPLWAKRRYYKKATNVAEYKDSLSDNNRTIDFNDNHILFLGQGVESKLPITTIEKIIEISSLIILKLKSGNALLIPKKEIDDRLLSEGYFKNFSTQYNIPYITDNEWRWK